MLCPSYPGVIIPFCDFLDWEGSPAGRDWWLCRSLHHTAGMWLFKGNMVAPYFELKCVPRVHVAYPDLILELFFFHFAEQGQAREAAGSSWDVLPEAGALSNALRLGNRQHHGGHLNRDARPWRHRLWQPKRGCVYLPWHLLHTAYRSVSDVISLLFQGNPAASTGEHSCPGGIRSATTPLMISFATFLHSNPLQSRSARSLSRFVNHVLSPRGSG